MIDHTLQYTVFKWVQRLSEEFPMVLDTKQSSILYSSVKGQIVNIFGLEDYMVFVVSI